MEPCRVSVNPEKEPSIEPYIMFLVDLPTSKLGILSEKKPGLDIELDCESPRSQCKCYGTDCDLVEKIESYNWEDFWHRIGDKANMVLTSDRWVKGCGLHTRIYIWPPNRIVVSHDTVHWEGVHLIYIDLKKLKEKVKKLLEEG